MNDRGYTLTELLVACAVLGVVMAGVFVLQQQGQFAYLWGAARVEVQQNARLALDLVTRELRSAQSVTSCASSKLAFKDSGGVDVVYERIGAAPPYRLLRTRNNGATTSDVPDNEVIGGVQAFTITCYTSDGYTSTTDPATVRSVLIQVQTRVADTGVSSSSLAAQQAIVESRVKLRNL